MIAAVESDSEGFVLAVAGAFGMALLLWSVLRVLGERLRGLFPLQAALLSILAWPLLIPAKCMGLRALALVLCIELWFKMIDFARQAAIDRTVAGFAAYSRFLIPFPALLVTFGRRNNRLPHRTGLGTEILRVGVGVVLFGLGFALVHFANGLPLLRSSFILDHVVKVSIFVLTIEGLSWALYCAERLTGFDTELPIRLQFLSRSVGEFWNRYNVRIHEWFENNVFRPAGGRRNPVRGLILVFLISGTFHELGMAIAISRFEGYQLAFFAIQAPAVLLSHRLNRFAKRHGVLGRMIAHGSTLIWMFASSVLFFHGVNRIFPFFYSAEPLLP